MPLAPEIDAPGIKLRGLGDEDVSADYVEWLNDPAVNRYLETRHSHQSAADIIEFVKNKAASADEYLFGIFLGEDGRHVGNIKLGPVRHAHRLAEVSLVIGARDAQGKGIGKASIAAVSEFGLRTLGLRKLTATIYADNIPSIRAFAGAGWRQEAVLPQHYLHDGLPMDIVVMGIVG